MFLSAANTECSCEAILPNAPRSGKSCNTYLSAFGMMPSIMDAPCFKERLTCAAGQRRASSQENAIAGSSVPGAPKRIWRYVISCSSYGNARAGASSMDQRRCRPAPGMMGQVAVNPLQRMRFKPQKEPFFELATERLPESGARFEARNPS
jgi:hypothetical protein